VTGSLDLRQFRSAALDLPLPIGLVRILGRLPDHVPREVVLCRLPDWLALLEEHR
jgi:hypothetical protein